MGRIIDYVAHSVSKGNRRLSSILVLNSATIAIAGGLQLPSSPSPGSGLMNLRSNQCKL